MAKSETQKIMEVSEKSKKESEAKAFKQKARMQALNTAAMLNTIDSAGDSRRIDKNEVLPEAQKIYQWLIKDLV